MWLRCNYYLAVFLLVLPVTVNSVELKLTKEDAGITIEDGKITSVAAKSRYGDGLYESCSFKEGEDVYTINNADNPAILTIKGSGEFTANINTRVIATNTADGTPTQYHAVYVSAASDKKNITLGKNAKLYGAIKETSSVPVIQIEQALVDIVNNGLIEAKGEKQQIAVAISKETTENVTINNNGIITGDIIHDKQSGSFNLTSTIDNNKQITSDLIQVKKITNNAEAELTVDTLQAAELINSGTCKIQTIDLSENSTQITNNEKGVIDIVDKISEISTGNTLNVINNLNANFRVSEGSTVNNLTNKGKLQLVLSQAQQRNSILLNVKNTYTNTGTIEIDANPSGLKVVGELIEVPILQVNSAIVLATPNITSINPLVEVRNIRKHASENLLLCDLQIKKSSTAYASPELGFSAIEAQMADSLQLASTDAETLLNDERIEEDKNSNKKTILAFNNLQNSAELKQFLQERRPDDISSIALLLQHADAITSSRIKQRLEQQRKKRTKVIYFNKKRKYNFWMKAAYSKYKTEENSLISSLASSAKLRGIVMGLDTKIFNDRTFLGILMSYTKSDLTYTRAQELDGHSFATGLYGSYIWDKTYIDAMILASKAKNANTHSFAKEVIGGDISSKNLIANLFLGRGFQIKKYDINPKIGVQFNYINLAGYSLKNSTDTLAETHEKTNFSRTDGIVAAKISKRFDYKRAKIYPSLGIAGVFELKNQEVLHTAIMANDSYKCLAKLGMKRYIEYEAGVYLNYHNFIFEINYTHSTATGYKSGEIQAGLRFNM